MTTPVASRTDPGAPQPARDGRRAAASVSVLPTPRSDEEILDRLREGEPGAAAMLYDRYAEEVNRLVWRLLGADREHDDLVQQVFCKLLTSARRVRDPARLRAFVLQVAVNTVRSELRRRAVRRRVLVVEADADRFEGACVDLRGRELLRRTFAVLEKMPLGERIPFSLRHVDGRPLEEVAAATGCSLSTAKRRLARAERRFRSLASRDPLLADRVADAAGGRGAR